MSDINAKIIDYLKLEKQVRIDGLQMMDKSAEIPQRLLKEVSIFDRWIEHLANDVDTSRSGLHLQRVMPMLLKIAETIDNAVENTDPDDDIAFGKISDVVELLGKIHEDNRMLKRN